MAKNPFDQFDSEQPAANPFDQFDAGAPKPKGLASDAFNALKKGAEQLPGVVTGIADIPLGLAGLNRPASRAADALGELTGFQPGKWAKEADANYSPETQASRAEINQAWDDPNTGAMDVAKAYLRNPRATAMTVLESVPSMLAGGAAGRGVGIAAKGLSAIGRAAAGEGLVGAGQQMAQIDEKVDPQRAAAASLATGAGTAALGAASGKVAARLGIGDLDTALAGGATGQTVKSPGLAKRVAAGAAQEGLIEEAPQSALEQVAQNYAEDKPLGQGVARNAVEGAIAGSTLGAGAAVPRTKPSEAMGLDPANGPMSAAAAVAVDTGAHLALPAPTVTVDSEGNAKTADQRQGERDNPGPRETGAVGQGRNSDEIQPLQVPDGPPALGYDTAPTGRLIADPDGTLRPETRAEAINAQQVQAGQQAATEAERQQRTDLGQSNFTPVTPIEQQAEAPAAPPAPDVPQIPLDTTPTGRMFADDRGNVLQETRADTISRDQPTETIIPNRVRAGKMARDAGPGFEVVPVTGGFVVRPVPEARILSERADAAAADQARVAAADRVASFDQASAAAESAKQQQLDQIQVQSRETLGRLPDQQVAAAQAATDEAPTAMQLAMQRARAQQGSKDVGATGNPGRVAAGDGAAGRVDAVASVADAGRVQPDAAGNGTNPAGGNATDSGGDLAARGAERGAPAVATPESITHAAHEAATSPLNERAQPTEAQKAAGNYAKGHVKVQGLDITIENPKGSARSGKRPNGSTWSHEMSDHYGYIKRTKGADNEQVDVYVGPKPASAKVFVVDQLDQKTGGFDEHKAMLGFPNQMAAMKAYRSNFDKGWKVGPVKAMSVDEFKAWLKEGDTTAPASQAAAPIAQETAPPASAPAASAPSQPANSAEGTPRQPQGTPESAPRTPAPVPQTATPAPAPTANQSRPAGETSQRVPESRPSPDATPAPTGKEVSRDKGQAGDGMSEFRARQVRNQLAKANPGITYTAEEDASVKNGWVVVGRQQPKGSRKASKAATNEQPKFKRAPEDVAGGLDRATALRTLNLIKDGGLQRIRLVESAADLPESGQERIRSEGLQGIRGMYDPATDTTYLVRQNLKSEDDMLFVALHESFHRGLRKTFGLKVMPILQQIYDTNEIVREQADEYAAKMKVPRMEAIEEVLADMAGNSRDLQGLNGWDKLVKLIKDFVSGIAQKMGIKVEFTDEMVAELVAGASRAGMQDGVHIDAAATPLFSRAQSVASSMGSLTPDQEKAWKNVAQLKDPPTLKERFDGLRANLGTKIRQGVFDQFAPIAEVSQDAYVKARLSKGSDGTMEAALLYGKPFLRDGVPDVDVKDGGFGKVLASLKGEHDRFLMWVAAHRADRLKAEGKENLFTSDDISALKSLSAGQMADGTTRMPLYQQALKDLNAFNDSVLQMAVESGLIDPAARELFKGQPYVPFYRVMEEGDMKGPKFSSGLVNQQAFKKLKGGKNQLNGDLLENMLLNWSHLYSASARNRAAQATMDAAEPMAVAYKVPEGTKGAIKVMRNGLAEHWSVEDPYLLDAISALNYAPSPLMKPLAKVKNILTYGVTVNPAFKVRNLIRDSLSAIAQADLSFNPLKNVGEGWKATAKDSQIYASMLAGGGTIRFGTQENAARVRKQVEDLGGTMLDKEGWSKLADQVRTVWGAYEELGDRTENVNRAALYEQLIKKGKTHAEASFMARDLMDFSMSGVNPLVRFLGQSVPFFNARLQGLYKLGRAGAEDPKRFATMALAVSAASLGLMAAYQDDDDWKKREDWDRDAYWWFKIGNQAYRIPKPFELGSIGTIAERTAELMLNDEMTGKRFGKRIADMVFSTFAMDPTPQIVKPLLDVYANKDSFTGRAIEGLSEERLRPEDRMNERTTEVARFLGQLGLPDPVKLAKGDYSALSPKQIDFLLRGYFGWVGTTAASLADRAIRPVMDRGERPAMELRDTFLAGNFVESLPAGGSRYVTELYEKAKESEQAYASYRDALKRGDTEKAAAIKEEEGSKLRNRMAIEHAKQQLAKINAQARQVEANKLMSADAKRERLDEIEARRDAVARRVASVY